MNNTVSYITEGIRVSVRTAYQAEQSSPVKDYYFFAYEIEIINESAHTVQLLTREWHITDAVGKKRHVQGEGVVGKQPTLKPNEKHRYVSYCDFATMGGKMSGYFFMRRFSDDKMIPVKVPEFDMVVPFIGN